MRALLLAALLLRIAAQSSTGRVEILVRDANTREGVPGVPVTLTFKYPTEPAGPSTTLLTDPRGLAVFSGLDTGNYVMKLGEGYNALPFTDYTWIDPGEQKRIEIAVRRIGSVSVRILDSDGVPIKDSLVRLPAIVYEEGRRALREVPLSRHETDGDGVFRVTNIPPGDYYLQIDHLQVQPGEGKTQGALPLVLYYPGVADLASATSITVRGQDLVLGEMRLPPPQRSFKISGTVINPLSSSARAGLPSISFYLGAVDPEAIAEPVPAYGAVLRPTTDPSESSFEIGGLLPGTYAVYPMFLTADSAYITNKTIVTLGDQDAEGLRILLKPGVRVPAKVVVNGDASRVLGSVRVGLRSKERLPIMLDMNRTVLAQPPDPQTGELILPSVLENVRYGVSVTGLPPDAYVADVRVGALSILDEGSFQVREVPDPLEIQIGTQGGVIQGIVRDVASQAVPNATVVIVPDFLRRQNSFLYQRSITNSQGVFSVRGLAPGEYQLFAWASPPPLGAEEDPTFMLPFEGRGTRVRASTGVSAEAQLQLIR